MIRVSAFAVLTVAFAAPILAQTPVPERRPFTALDLHALKGVSSPEISPDGGWVAYTVGTDDCRRGSTGQ